DSDARLASGARNNSGGFVASGSSSASSTIDDMSTVVVAPSVGITAGHGLPLSANASHVSSTSGNARGGALVDFAKSRPSASVDYTTEAVVGSDAPLLAGNQLNFA